MSTTEELVLALLLQARRPQRLGVIEKAGGGPGP
jgi:hypothetical protein